MKAAQVMKATPVMKATRRLCLCLCLCLTLAALITPGTLMAGIRPAAAPVPPAPESIVGGLPSPNPTAGDLAAAQAAAQAAARRVDGLRLRYLDLTRRAQVAAGRLATAFAEQSRASGRHDADAAALAHAQAVRTASIRAVYADGGQLGLLGSVLSAGSADDALWRLGTARRIEFGVLQAERRDADSAALHEALSREAIEAAARSEAELAAALAGLQNDIAAADTMLARAQSELDRLDARARQVAAAQEAARRLAEARAAAAAARLAGATAMTALVIPPAYLTAYRASAPTCPGLDWTLLAAVGQIESGHGRNNGPSSAGAIGPMQFMPATFAQYGVDANRDGATDAWDYQDAIASAAAYLCASGARGGSPDGVREALFAYNRAGWYVDLVLAARAAIAAREQG
jgi:soluble lytic murein transglycosylase-like protein